MVFEFIKTHSLGNDFIIVDARARPAIIDDITPDIVRTLAARSHPQSHGCDQLIIISAHSDAGTIVMTTYNSNGSRAVACGNGVRVVAALTRAEAIETDAETLYPSYRGANIAEGHIGLTFGAPCLNWEDIPLTEACVPSAFVLDHALPPAFGVNIGNPHAVIFMADGMMLDDLDALGRKYGESLEHHSIFKLGANISFASMIARETFNFRTWERGAGMTTACGTGAAAVAIAACEQQERNGMMRLNTLRGQIWIDYRGADSDFIMIGPVPDTDEITRFTADLVRSKAGRLSAAE